MLLPLSFQCILWEKVSLFLWSPKTKSSTCDMLNKWINRWSNESYLRINDNTGVCYRIWGYYFPVKHKSCDSFVPVLPLKNVLENELVMEESINVVTCLYKSELMQIIFSQLVYSSVVSDSLHPYGLQCARPPCPSTPRVYSIHVHWVSDAIQPSHPLSSPSLPAFNLSQHQGLFKWVALHIRWPKYWQLILISFIIAWVLLSY